MCLYPTLRANKKYTVNKKNGGNVPAIRDERVKYVPTGCGNCMECRKQYARSWQVRLLEDVRVNKKAWFVTLTFSDESIHDIVKGVKNKNGTWKTEPIERLDGYLLDNEICTRAVKWWRERWRKKWGVSPRHWLITELGHQGTKNVHMHGIVWIEEKMRVDKETGEIIENDIYKSIRGREMAEIERTWGYGGLYDPPKNFVNEKTVNYLIKYVHKVDKEHEYYKPKVLTSPGMGEGYINRIDSERNKYKGEETKEYYTTRTGHKMSLPMYWRNKIYTDDEREELWLQKLDKQERWVGGEKIDISKSEKDYWKVLEWYRDKNKRLGYGSNEINWDKKLYENQQRRLRILQRIKRAKGEK